MTLAQALCQLTVPHVKIHFRECKFGMHIFNIKWMSYDESIQSLFVDIQSENIIIALYQITPCLFHEIHLHDFDNFILVQTGNGDNVMWKKYRPQHSIITKFVFETLLIFGITFWYFCSPTQQLYSLCICLVQDLTMGSGPLKEKTPVNNSGCKRIPVSQTGWAHFRSREFETDSFCFSQKNVL